MKFGTVTQFDTIEASDRKFVISKIQDGGDPVLKNIKIAISRPQVERFRRNLARCRSSTILTVPTVKNLRIKHGGSRHL